MDHIYILLASLIAQLISIVTSDPYLGVYIGDLDQYDHDVSGKVYIIGETQIRLMEFNYDGEGPSARFCFGIDSDIPDPYGECVADEFESTTKLGSYVNRDVTINLPEGQTVHTIKWFSVWCQQNSADFGSILFADTLFDDITVPETYTVGPGFSRLAHQLSSGPVTFINTREVSIESIIYDGYGPAAFFWVGSGSPSSSGSMIPGPGGSTGKLPRYSADDITVTLPEGQTWSQYDYLSMWCELANQNFGHVNIPDNINLPPYMDSSGAETLDNCQPLHEYLKVSWSIQGEDIHYELAGSLDGEDGYMAFGQSGSSTGSTMLGADVFVAYWRNGRGYVDDYFLSQYAQCNQATGDGACPDIYVPDASNQQTIQVIASRQINSVTYINFKRPLVTGDTADLETPANGDMYIVWAMGILSADGIVTRHNLRQQDTGLKLATGLGCSADIVPREETQVTPWEQQTIEGVTEFRAVIGLPGGDRGYSAIAGRQSWGIAWWINGQLIPILRVEKNITYTFAVEGGNDPDNSARNHPFYITDSSTGGYGQKNAEDRALETIYAGVDSNGDATAAGRLCQWEVQNDTQDAESYETFESFKADLELVCDDGEPATLTFKADKTTPATLYYQCFTHNYLGWKIEVIGGVAPSTSTSGTASKQQTLSIQLLYSIVLLTVILLM